MSRKHSTRSRRRGRPASVVPALSMEELKARWDSLRLQPQTRAHLEQILQAEGVGLAFAATVALDLEMQREEQKVTHSIWEWITEELRLSFLEEGCQHVLETGRLLIDAGLTWTAVQGPFLVRYLLLLLIVLAVVLIGTSLLPLCRRRGAAMHGRRK